MRNPAIDVSSLLLHQPLFTNLPEGSLDEWTGYVREKRLQRGEVLFHRGASAGDAFWLIAVGQIKLSFPSSSGNERVLTTLSEKQCFGEAQALLGEPYPYTAEALSDALLLRVDRAIYTKLQQQAHPLLHCLMTGMATRIHDLLHEIEQISVYSGMERVARYLLRHCPDGDNCRCGGCTVELPMAKQLLASRLNLKPETLSRIFHDLASEGTIEVEGRRIILRDVARLRVLGCVGS